MKARFPGFALSPDTDAILDAEGGILRADKMVAAFQVNTELRLTIVI